MLVIINIWPSTMYFLYKIWQILNSKRLDHEDSEKWLWNLYTLILLAHTHNNYSKIDSLSHLFPTTGKYNMREDVQSSDSQGRLTWRPDLSWGQTGQWNTKRGSIWQGSLALHVVCKSAGQGSNMSNIAVIPYLSAGLYSHIGNKKGKGKLCSMSLRWRWSIGGEGNGQSLLPSLKLISRKRSFRKHKSRSCKLARYFAK